MFTRKTHFLRRSKMLGLLAAILLTVALRGQTPAAETKDPLGRSTPQASVFHFLEACHAREYAKALHYLALPWMPPEQPAKDGPALGRQLEDLLDATPFVIAPLSRDAEG